MCVQDEYNGGTDKGLENTVYDELSNLLSFTECYYNNQIKGDVMDMASTTHGKVEKYISFWLKNIEERGHL